MRRNGAGCLRRLIFLHQPVRDASGGILFSGSSEKSMQKRDAGERNSAYAPEKLFVSLYVLSFCFRRLNALRAVVQSGFPSARYTVRVALFAPVEYLTYGSRKAVLPARAALRIARNDFPCKGHPKQAQSISTTTPVYQRRICGAFCKLKKATARTKLRGKSKEGGRSPLLGRFKGDCQGGESKLPLDYAFFRPSTALSFSYEKESGVETVPFLPRQKRVDCRRHSY